MKHDDETKLAVCVEVKDNYCVVICRECGKLTKMYAINGVFDGKNAYCNKHQLKIIK